MATSTAVPMSSATPRAAAHRGRLAKPAAVAALALAGVGVVAVLPGDRQSASTLSTAPAFSLPDVRGGAAPVTLGAGGRPVVVNFFASWCEPCREELPLLEATSRRLAGTVDVVGVDVNDSRTAAVALLEHTGATFPAGYDPHRTVATRYRLQGMPTTVFVDGAGRVTDVARGRLTAADLDRYLDRLGVPAGVGTDRADEKG